MVGGVDADERRAARRIDRGVDRQARVARRIDQPGVPREHVVGLGDPIGLWQARDEGGEARLVPAERLGEALLLGGDPLGAAALLVA